MSSTTIRGPSAGCCAAPTLPRSSGRGAGLPTRLGRSSPPARPAYFGGDGNGRAAGWIDTPILRRSDLVTGRSGPLIVEEYDATCVVPPDATASLDAGGNIVITLT